MVAGVLIEGVTGVSVQDCYAVVLLGSIGEQQLCAHRANLRPLRIFQHGLDPIGADHFDVVVEDQQLFTLG